MCIWFHQTTVRLSWFFVQINILEGRAGYVVSMGRVSVTISYSFRCLTTETVKYINENSFIAFAFMHLADAFIQSDLQCIQAMHFLSVCVYIYKGWVSIQLSRFDSISIRKLSIRFSIFGLHSVNIVLIQKLLIFLKN